MDILFKRRGVPFRLWGPIFADEFGSIHPDSLFLFDRGEDLAALMVRGGIFPSFSQARKRGCSGFIPLGLTVFRVNKHEIWIYNPLEGIHTFTYEYRCGVRGVFCETDYEFNQP